MELICNELSFYPLANNSYEAVERFRLLLMTFKSANEKYSFNHIRFPKSYAAQYVISNLTLFEWISTLSNPTLKSLILSLFKSPFTDDLEEAEMNHFFASSFVIKESNVPVSYTPVGLPVAHIKSLPCISFKSHVCWQNRLIELSMQNDNSGIETIFSVYNLCDPVDLEMPEIIVWSETSLPEFVDSTDNLSIYLNYTRLDAEFTDDFMEQLFSWKEKDFDVFRYILLLMKDVELHPFTGGRGQTENLKNRGKEASKRINNVYPNADRLSYIIENNVVTFLACEGHYTFH